MQNDQINNNDSVSGIGMPPALQDDNYSTVSPTQNQVASSTDNNTTSNYTPSTPAINLNESRTPLNSVSASSPSDSTMQSEKQDSGNLLDIKKQALQQLQPLVDRLDLNPEEKFNTTMMMIQASDDQSLINKAFDAAQQITDEKDKAQALLDIVNEINYFTHSEEVK